MRKVMLVVITMVLLTIPSGLEVDLDLEQLERDVAEAPYSPEDYVLGVFDCSNMAMVLGQTLEEKGYIVVVVTATRWTEDDDLVSHAWILVNGIAFVEPTLKKIVDPRLYEPYFWREGYLGTESLWQKMLQKEERDLAEREWKDNRKSLQE